VVDDHRIFAESLAAALAAEPDVDVSAAGSGPAAQRCLDRAVVDNRRYDVVLVDADLGGEPRPPVTLAAVPPLPVGAGVAGPAGGTASAAAAGLSAAARAAVSAGPTGTTGPTRPAGISGAPGMARALEPRDPVLDGLALVERVRAEHPGTRTVVLAERDDPVRAARALQAGAFGWVAKDCSLSRLLAVVRGVLRDETHLPPALLTGVLRELTAARRDRTESERLVESLTPREQEVLRCMVAGLGRKAVAERLFLSPHTVRTHMQNVLGKLGVHSTLAAVALARRAGVGPADSGAGAVPSLLPSLAPSAGDVVERRGQLS
jgi:DNA-binding NarL/FixJ family response regulator